MANSTHRCDVVVVYPQPHPNADRLDVVLVDGYSVCVRKGDFKDGDLAIYIPPDSIVPPTEQFQWVWEARGYAPPPHYTSPNHVHIEVPEKYRRIKAKVLRGVISEGILIPLDAGLESKLADKYGYLNKEQMVGQNAAGDIGITHYDPPEDVSLGGDCEPAPGRKAKKRKYPRTLKGWLRLIWHKLSPRGTLYEHEEDTDFGFHIPDYNVEPWQKFGGNLIRGELIWITEKIHGANCRFVWIQSDPFASGRMYVGSHYQWKKESLGCTFWQALYRHPWIKEFCHQNPGLVLYGELIPTNKMNYGQKKGDYKVLAFDVLDPSQQGPGQPQGKWLTYAELQGLDFAFDYMESTGPVSRGLLDAVHWVPTVAQVAYNEKDIRQYSTGRSLVPNANHIREGIVIRPVNERHDPRHGRIILKLVSPEYLQSKHADE